MVSAHESFELGRQVKNSPGSRPLSDSIPAFSLGAPAPMGTHRTQRSVCALVRFSPARPA
jgi:hypothetical protein